MHCVGVLLGHGAPLSVYREYSSVLESGWVVCDSPQDSFGQQLNRMQFSPAMKALPSYGSLALHSLCSQGYL